MITQSHDTNKIDNQNFLTPKRNVNGTLINRIAKLEIEKPN